jgi:6-aminohexanoate-oligomer endohydrolase
MKPPFRSRTWWGLLAVVLLTSSASLLPAPPLQPGSTPTPRSTTARSLAEPKAPVPETSFSGPALEFDFPTLQIGVAEYQEGPTGMTLFYFPKRAMAVVDVRGGAPGTTITDALRLGYERANIDAITFAGGSYYGLEAASSVAAQLRELRETNRTPGVAAVPGAIIFDLGERRFNTLSPDPALARAAFAAARPGRFPLGTRGAGRSTRQGSFFGERAKSGQGGAFRQAGATKVAVFTIVNAVGSVVDREGNVVRCNHPAEMGISKSIADHFKKRPYLEEPRKPTTAAAEEDASLATANTTITLVVTNQKLSYGELQRLAVQVHTSMGRAIQPFATRGDGDALFAVTTQEIENPELSAENLAVLAGEVAWDAILASVPPAPAHVTQGLVLDTKVLDTYVGQYEFGSDAVLAVTRTGSRLFAQASGKRAIYGFALKDPPSELTPVSDGEFQQQTRWQDRVMFVKAPGGQVTGLVLNPGLEHIFAKKVNVSVSNQ